MNMKLIILFGTVAAVHLCAARPESKSSEELKKIEKDNELRNIVATFLENFPKKNESSNDRAKNLITIFREYFVHTREAIQEWSKVCKLVIKEPFLEKLNTAYIRSEVEKFNNYVKKAESLDTKEGEELLDTLEHLYYRLDCKMDVLYSSMETLMETPTMEDVIFGLAFEKNGIVEANKKVEESFSKFLVKMFGIVDKYIANLSVENRQAETNLINSVQKYKTLDLRDQRKNFWKMPYEIESLSSKEDE